MKPSDAESNVFLGLAQAVLSSGKALSLSTAWARPKNTLLSASDGFITARLHSPIPSITPGSTSVGITPARAREDFPDPEAPSIRRNPLGSSLSTCVFLRLSTAAPLPRVRPKKIGLCSNSNGSKPTKWRSRGPGSSRRNLARGTLRKLGTSTLHDLAQLDFDQFLELSEGLVVGERPDKSTSLVSRVH